MSETVINTALWTVSSILTILAMARMLRKADPEPAPIRIRVDEAGDKENVRGR